MSDYYAIVEKCLKNMSTDELILIQNLSDDTKRFTYSREIYKKFDKLRAPVNQIQKNKNKTVDYRERGFYTTTNI